MSGDAPFSQAALRAAVAGAMTWSDALRALGYEPKGQNYRTLKRWVARWGISVEHFNANHARSIAGRARARPLAEICVEDSDFARGKLKARLFREGVKQRVCELCGQDEHWRGRRMALILDHINGVANDNRLENLQIVCPNCAATLDTHCGRNLPQERACVACGTTFAPQTIQHRYCSNACVGKRVSEALRNVPRPERRVVERPPYEQLMADVASMSMCAVGRKYGVSDNAVRKWIRWYEQAGEGGGAAQAA